MPSVPAMIAVCSTGSPICRWPSSRTASRIVLAFDTTSSTALTGSRAGTASSPAAARPIEALARPNATAGGWISGGAVRTGRLSKSSTTSTSCSLIEEGRVEPDQKARGERPGLDFAHALDGRQLGLDAMRKLAITRERRMAEANAARRLARNFGYGKPAPMAEPRLARASPRPRRPGLDRVD